MLTSEINIRDPFVLVHEGKYYLYGTRGESCWGPMDGFDVYVGSDLEHWDGPFEVFHNPGDFWADRNYWAPEVYYYRDAFYMFATFNSETQRRGTQVLKSELPLGPFVPISEGPVTPRDWECIDGTFYVEEGIPYMVFCHEHTQITDGEICMMPLSCDLKNAAGEPVTFFKASQAEWVRPVREEQHYITDGPYLYRCHDKEHTLLMIWSSFGEQGYGQAVAKSLSNTVRGPWVQKRELLFERDGGHGMIFEGLDGRFYLTLHSPNTHLEERPVFNQIEEEQLYQGTWQEPWNKEGEQ